MARSSRRSPTARRRPPSGRPAVCGATGRFSGAPGFTRTDLSGNTGTRSVEESPEIVVRMAAVGADGPTGTFTDIDGPLPW